mgnify:CR=1 FL=1
MYLVMNVITTTPERASHLEQAFAPSPERMKAIPGFIRFELLRERGEEGAPPRYSAATWWEDEAAFKAWTESEAFRAAHARAGSSGAGAQAQMKQYDVVV